MPMVVKIPRLKRSANFLKELFLMAIVSQIFMVQVVENNFIRFSSQILYQVLAHFIQVFRINRFNLYVITFFEVSALLRVLKQKQNA